MTPEQLKSRMAARRLKSAKNLHMHAPTQKQEAPPTYREFFAKAAKREGISNSEITYVLAMIGQTLDSLVKDTFGGVVTLVKPLVKRVEIIEERESELAELRERIRALEARDNGNSTDR